MLVPMVLSSGSPRIQCAQRILHWRVSSRISRLNVISIQFLRLDSSHRFGVLGVNSFENMARVHLGQGRPQQGNITRENLLDFLRVPAVFWNNDKHGDVFVVILGDDFHFLIFQDDKAVSASLLVCPCASLLKG